MYARWQGGASAMCASAEVTNLPDAWHPMAPDTCRGASRSEAAAGMTMLLALRCLAMQARQRVAVPKTCQGCFAKLPARHAIHNTVRPTARQISTPGSEASGPKAPPVSHSGNPERAVLRAMAGPMSVPETAAPNR